jgi:hypothetical protein
MRSKTLLHFLKQSIDTYTENLFDNLLKLLFRLILHSVNLALQVFSFLLRYYCRYSKGSLLALLLLNVMNHHHPSAIGSQQESYGPKRLVAIT